MRTAILLLLVLAPLAPAQSTSPQAVKAARAASKAALTEFRQRLGDARDVFVAEVTATETLFKAGTGGAADLDALFDQFQVMQASVQQAVKDACLDTASGARDALVALAGGFDLDGQYPLDLQIGRAGVFEDARASIDRLLARTYDTLNRRLDRTEALLTKLGDQHLRVWVGPPGGSLQHVATDGIADVLPVGFTIDALWARRELGVPGAGVLLASGPDGSIAAGPGLTFTAIRYKAQGIDTLQAEVVRGALRWTVSFEDLPRGSYLCFVSPTGGFVSRNASFGMP
jgi:hypothetical protein